MSDITQKIEAFKALLGDDANEILAAVAQTQKAAEDAGTAFKEVSQPVSEEEQKEILWQAYKEFSAEPVYDEEDYLDYETEKAEHEPEEDKKKPSFVTRTEFKAKMDEIMAAIHGGKKAKETAVDSRLDEIQQAIESLTSEQPRALKSGYRASQHAAPAAVDGTQGSSEAETRYKEAIQQVGPQVAQFMPLAETFAAGLMGDKWSNGG